VLAVLAPFFFPAPVAFGIAIIAALFIPAISIISGGLIDLLYFEALHGTSLFPYFTIFGVIVALISAAVQQFLKTRIMS
jgi:hypothetical protein